MATKGLRASQAALGFEFAPGVEGRAEFTPEAAPETRPPGYLEHRKRLRERFDRGGAAPMEDYELLELILFQIIPRRDVKPLAKRLLKEFGDFNHVLSASASRLRAADGLGPESVRGLKIVEAAAHRLAQARVLGREALSSWSELMDYCKVSMAHREIEEFRILFLDRKNVLIADEPQARGTVDHVPVYPREVAKRALELGASALILVHNHPSGDPTPSQADIDVTRMVEAALKTIGVVLHDHVVIGKERDSSFRTMGLL